MSLRRLRHLFVSPFGIVAALVRTVVGHPGNKGHRGRALLRLAVATSYRSLGGEAVVAALGERSRIVVEPRWLTPAEASTVYSNPPDYPLTRIWYGVLRAGDTACDIGANVGIYSLLAAERGANVIAVEPSTSAFQRLLANSRLNDYTARIDAVQVAVGRQSGTTSLTTGIGILNHVVEDPEQISEELIADKFLTLHPTGTERVDMTTIDELIGSRYIMAMKLDIEGQEENALLGATNALRERRIGYLQMEANTAAAIHYGRSVLPALEILRQFGYTIYVPTSSGTLLPITEGYRSSDVIAVDPDGPFWDRYRSLTDSLTPVS